MKLEPKTTSKLIYAKLTKEIVLRDIMDFPENRNHFIENRNYKKSIADNKQMLLKNRKYELLQI